MTIPSQQTFPTVFIVLQSLAVLLLASWFWQPTYEGWVQLDLQVFHLLNSSLALSHAWQWVWALCNCRPFDGLVFLLFLFTVIRPDWTFRREVLKQVFVLLVATSITALFIRYGMKTYFEIKRSSPSLVVDGALRLRDLVPVIPAKDQSHGSFPGDHASLTFVWWLVVMFFTHKRAWRYAATAIMIVLLLPRLIAGAHWLTDDLIGGLFVALLAVAWVCYSPLKNLTLWIGLPILNTLLMPFAKSSSQER